MSTQGTWLGGWPGDWFGPVETVPGSMSGTATISFAGSGALVGQGELAGATTVSFAGSGDLTAGAGNLAGAATVSFAATGDLTALAGETVTRAPRLHPIREGRAYAGSTRAVTYARRVTARGGVTATVAYAPGRVRTLSAVSRSTAHTARSRGCARIMVVAAAAAAARVQALGSRGGASAACRGGMSTGLARSVIAAAAARAGVVGAVAISSGSDAGARGARSLFAAEIAAVSVHFRR